MPNYTHEQFIKEIGKDNIGFKYHVIIDGVDYAYSTSCSKDNFTEYLKLIIFSMVATAHYKGLITEKEFQELRP